MNLAETGRHDVRQRSTGSNFRRPRIAFALAILASGVGPTQALVLSQVILSFGIPFALAPLVLLSRCVDLMGPFVNRRLTTLAGAVVALVISALNVFLLARTVLG